MKKAAQYSEVYTVEEFAKIFKLSLKAVQSLIRDGEISVIRIGKQYRIPQIVVDRYFAQALTPEERGFGIWKQNRIPALTYVNKLRARDRRTPQKFLKTYSRMSRWLAVRSPYWQIRTSLSIT